LSPEEIKRLRELAAENGILPIGSDDELAAELNSARPKVRILGDERELIHFADDVGKILGKHEFYRRDRMTVGINREKARVELITAQAMRSLAQRHIVFFKERKIGLGNETATIEIVKTMNVDTARGLMESWEFIDRLTEIDRVNPIRMPIMRSDRRIELAPPGYYRDGRIFTLDDVAIDETMTFERGKKIITDLLCEFPFHDDGRSRAVQVAAMMTIFCACLLPKWASRPGFIYTANDSDAGKTLLAQVAVIPIYGQGSARAFPRKEETRKVLDQLAQDATTTVIFDNVRGQLGGEDIESFMSAPRWKGRILGEKGGFEVDNVTTCFFTGNECRPTRDMAQRCLFVELFLEELDSSAREIQRQLTPAVLADMDLRRDVCSAMWSLVRQWDADGRPGCKKLGIAKMPKCPEWSEIVAAIVAHTGFGNPCLKPDIKSAKTGVNEMQELVKHMTPDESVTEESWNFSEIMHEVKTEGFFENLEVHGRKGDSQELFDSEGEPTPAGKSFFGRFFASFDGRLFSGKSGERLRWVVQGKGNQRKYLVVREGVEAVGSGENIPSEASASSAEPEA